MVEHSEECGIVEVHLPGNLGTDASARSGDENTFSFENGANAGFLGGYGSATQKVLFAHIGEVS